MSPRGPAQQHGTSTASTLPKWITAKGEGGTLRITCPRCGGKAIVNRQKWLASREQFGRSCTYCFFTNQIPEALR